MNPPSPSALRTHLLPVLERHGCMGFVLFDRNFGVLASDRDPLIGLNTPPGDAVRTRSTVSRIFW